LGGLLVLQNKANREFRTETNLFAVEFLCQRTHAGDGRDRLFVVDRPGKIWLIENGRLLYADLGTGLIREFVLGIDECNLGLYVKAFGQDADGELYLLAGTNLGPFGTGGMVLKIVDLCTERIPGDINNDCKVDIIDFNILIEHWMENTLR